MTKSFIAKNKYNIIFAVIMLVLFFWGITVFRDYGISWDEEIQRNRGLAGLRTLITAVTGNAPGDELLNREEVVKRGTGLLGIKLPVVLAEYFTHFSLTNGQVFRIYHLYNFLIFFVSVFFAWRLFLLLGFSEIHALIGVLLYVTCPRVLADSFYNNKDIIFLSLYTIIISLSVSVVEKYALWKLVLLALSAALGFNTRAIGLLPCGFFFGYYLFGALKDKSELIKRVIRMCILGITWFVFYFLMTPRMWGRVVNSLVKKVAGVFSFSHGGFDTIAGMIFNRLELPWYYLPFTIMLTVPCIYLIFGAVGTIGAFIREAGADGSNDNRADKRRIYILLLLTQYVFVVGYTMVVKPMQYNYWRHFFFIFIYMVVFTLYGLRMIAEHSRLFKQVAYVFTAVSIALSVRWIAVNHPYEYLYFNPLFNDTWAKNSDQDYWKVAYQGLLSEIRDDSVTDVYLFPTLTGNQLFGELGFENYHLEALKHSAKYRIEDGNPGDNSFYKILSTVEVDGRICESLIRRENYGNVIRKYYLENGIAMGANYGREAEIDAYTEGTDSCILIRLPEGMTAKEIDLLYGGAFSVPSAGDDETEEESVPDKNLAGVANLRAYLSEDGISYTRADESHVLNESDTFGIAADDKLPEYVLIKYENLLMGKQPDFALRIYGDDDTCNHEGFDRGSVYYNRYEAREAVKELTAMDNGKDCSLMTDGKEATAYTFASQMNGKESIELELKEGYKPLRGIHIDCGSAPMNGGRDIVIEASRDGKSYTRLDYYYGAADDYLFENPGEYSFYRISQRGRSSYSWSIAELGLIVRQE